MGNEANVSINIAANNAASATLKQVQTDLLSVGRQAEGTGVAFAGATASTGRLDTLMGKLSLSSNEGVGRMRGMTSAMAFMGLQAVGAQGPVARLGEGLLMFGGGHVAVLALAAVLVGVGFAMKAMGDGSDEARKKIEELEKQTDKTFKESRPEIVKYSEAQKRLSQEVEAARDAHLKATLAVIDFKNQMNDLNNSEDTQAGLQVALTKATNAQDDAQDRLNKALIASNQALAEHRQKMQDHIDTLKLQADAVGLSAEAVVRLQLAHEHFTPKLIDQAVTYTRLKDVREAQLALDKYYASTSDDQFTRMMGVPSDTMVARMDRYIQQLKNAHEAELERTEGTGPASLTADEPPSPSPFTPVSNEMLLGAGGEPIEKHLSTVKKIAQGFLEAAGNAQTLSAVIGGALLQTVTAVGDGFIEMFQAIFDGSQNAAKGFALAMINAIKQVARLAGMNELAEAAKAVAQGILGNPGAFAGAAKHLEAAGLFFAVAGAAGAAAGAIGGGGSGGNGGLSPASVTSQSQQAKGSGTIIIQGGILDMGNPQQADALAKALSDLSGRQIIMQGRS